MALTLDATVSGPSANTFGSLAEADAYFESREPLLSNGLNVWTQVTEQVKFRRLIQATRILCYQFNGRKVLRVPENGDRPYWIKSRQWKGTIADSLQALVFPRTGLLDRLGRSITDMEVNPIEIKEAEFELAGQLGLSDRTLDNQIAIQGITSVKADVVQVDFRDGLIVPQVIPDAVLNLIPDSWLTDEVYLGTRELVFESLAPCPGRYRPWV